MKEIIINSANAQRTFAAEDDATLNEILDHDDVKAFFDADFEDIAENLVGLNDNEITDGIRGMILGASPENGAEVDIAMESVEVEDVRGNGGEEGTPGRVTVNTSGGLQSTVIDITNGVTTLYQAIYNDTVRARSGMNDTQLSSCVVVLNGDAVCAGALETTRLHDNDTITLNARAASIKG